MDEKFAERLARISAGQQWQPAGVVDARGFRGRRRPLPLLQRPNVRFGILTAAALGLTALGVGPSAVGASMEAMLGPETLAMLAETSGTSDLMSMIPGL
jgi:hypothetical protein